MNAVDVVRDDVDAVSFHAQTRGAFWTQKRLIEPYMIATIMRPGSVSSKPVDEAIERSPEWYQQLVFAFTVMIALLEITPGIGAVESLRFDCDQFDDGDQLLLRGNLPDRAARAILGNIQENMARLVVNEAHALDFQCDCRGGTDLTVYLPGSDTWLTNETLTEIASRIAAELGVPARTL